MATFGYGMSSEEHTALDLVDRAVKAEQAGFAFASISDHYHPWLEAQGNSPFVWTVLGGIAARTTRLEVGVGVTCPTVRIHPAVLAQATATTASLFEGRFTWGVGTGEALNEHILGDKWPVPEVRLEMLEEAVEVIRRLWTGETVDHRGRHYTVENARLFSLPEAPPPIVVSAFGPKAIELAARIGDGYWGTSPEAELLEQYAQQGGTGPRWGQVTICWGEDEDAAREVAATRWANAGVKGQLSQDLPTWTHFEQAASMVPPEEVTSSIPCGPDPGPVLESVQQYLDAGYDHVYLTQIGDDQEGFFGFWERELAPKLL